MKTSWRILAIVLVVLVVLGGGLSWFLVQRQGPRVAAFTPVRQPLTQTLLVTGRVVQPIRTELGAMVQSTVVEVLVDEGDTVEEGALLVRLADEEAAARVAEAEAAVAEAEARLGRVRGVGRQVAGERLEQARIEAEQASRDYERQQTLFDDGAVTEAQLEVARQRRDQARSQEIAAKLEVAASGQTGADTAAAAAALARAQAGLEGARAALSRARIRAPSAGRILRRLVDPGQVVRPGDPLLQFAAEGALEVRITPDETHLGRLRVGLPARVATEAFPSDPLQAHVHHVAPQVDPSRGTVEVRLTLDDPSDAERLLPDMTATVEVILGEAADALVLPNRLVRDLGTGAPWVLLARDGEARRVPVTLGLEGTDAIEIRDGVEPGDLVLPADADVEPGDPVRTRRPQPALPPQDG